MKKIYETSMISIGGRNGQVTNADDSFTLDISTPGAGGEGTNPEQLFAAGFSACFNSALSMVLAQAKKRAESVIEATVSLIEDENKGYEVAVVLEGKIEGFSKEETLEWMKKAHQVCPYSKATQGNIELELTAVE